MIKVLIIDDEPLARFRISDLLKKDPDVFILGECKNGTEAVRHIHQKNPDLIFLDVQMPDLDGFEVVSQLKADPLVIFVTAFDQYALNAFDVHAVDYLLKPFDDQRFFDALERAKRQIGLQQTSQFKNKLLNLMQEFQAEPDQYLSAVTLKDRGKTRQIALEDVLWVEADGNYLALHLANEHVLYRSTMNAFESDINPTNFLRIHRSLIINNAHIKDVQYQNNNEYQFQLSNNHTLVSGRLYKEKIEAALEKTDFISNGSS